MNWLQTILVSFFSGILGLILGGLLGIACVKWFRITSFEGASGYAVVGIAILGAIVSAMIGLIVARWNGGGADPSLGAVLLRATMTLGSITLIIAGICRLCAHPQAFENSEPAPQAETVVVEDRFALPGADAPLSDWLSVVSHGAPEATMHSVIHAVSQRPEFLTEAKEIIFAEDHYLAAAALRMMAKASTPTPECNALVSEAGNDVADRIRVALSTPAESDPSFREVANIAIRFYGWIEAAEALRVKNEGNFIAELKAILEQAEPGTESSVLQNDVCRIARHHLDKWSGPEN